MRPGIRDDAARSDDGLKHTEERQGGGSTAGHRGGRGWRVRRGGGPGAGRGGNTRVHFTLSGWSSWWSLASRGPRCSCKRWAAPAWGANTWSVRRLAQVGVAVWILGSPHFHSTHSSHSTSYQLHLSQRAASLAPAFRHCTQITGKPVLLKRKDANLSRPLVRCWPHPADSVSPMQQGCEQLYSTLHM